MQKHFSITQSTGDIAKETILKTVVFGLVDEMLEFREAVNSRFTPALDYRMTLQADTEITPLAKEEGARADYQTASWFDVSGTLQTYQNALMFTDETKARQMGNVQISTSLDACARGLAKKKDYNIMTALTAGVGDTHSASATWDDAVASDPAQDIAEAISSMLANSNMSARQIADVKLFVPASVWPYLSKPVQVGEIQKEIRTWAQDAYNISFYPTRLLTTNCLALVKSDRTAIIIEHDGSKLPSIETFRNHGVGDGYIFTQAFDAKVMPNSKTDATSNLIYNITGVSA
jgi:hypothetical protein